MTDTYTVHQLTTYIRDLLDGDPALQGIWVEGEISNFRRAPSGHLYFTLKDGQSELACVMWRSQAARLGFEPQQGDAALAGGSITVYPARGQYQLVCETLQPAGVGDLHREFERLKAQLEAEGLFDPDRKRPIPPFPRRIGIVTSPTTAAFQDIQNVLRRRYPAVEVILSPATVQGRDAPPQIVAAIERLNRHTDVDVIVVARGGGSLEDLWCFNDETVVRAVAGSRIPVVTGVGHEIDFTLVDFAADQRAPTPSAAAELVTPDGDALRLDIRVLAGRMNGAARSALDTRRSALNAHHRLLDRLTPLVQVRTARQRIDDLTARLDTHFQHGLVRRRDRLTAAVRALDAANPAALLRRGYALVTRAGDGARVTSAQMTAEGTWLKIALHDGELTATVRQRDMHDADHTGDS
ncbi:MAG: exodeoxyribonuclease VII large subunit [Anaerolineae bacterium]|nr:exodeoxyribonuclease VII large subunit [Anaerolineae bacterium]